MMIRQLLQQAKDQLASVTDEPMLEAEVLLAHVLDKPRSYLYSSPERVISAEAAERFATFLQRRCQNEPIPYITGTKEFWSLELSVTSDTLIPRPETELLVETVLTLFPGKEDVIKLADLGTGSGAIALALASERSKWQISATDVSESALQIASKNAQRLGLSGVSFYLGSWCTALPLYVDYDVVVSNPPYVAESEWKTYADGLAFEPRNALVSGEDGLTAIREISETAKQYLKHDGYLVVEHGFLQGSAVRDIFAVRGYSGIYSVRDLSGRERITIGKLN